MSIKTSHEIELFAEAADFSEKVAKKIKGIVSIILYGSAARGEATRDSDVDIAVIYENKSDEIEKQVEKLNKTHRIHVTHFSIEDLKKETSIAAALSGDGILLHGRPVIFTVEEQELKPKVLLVYSIKHLSPPEKMKVQRGLYGYVAKSRHKGKVYTSEMKGLADEAGIEKLTDSVLFVDSKKAGKITALFRQHDVRWKEMIVWAL